MNKLKDRRAAHVVHGMSGKFRTPEYHAWTGARARCNNPNGKHYQAYGGRGVRMCKRWDSFQNFLKDMGPRPSDKHSLDRKNPYGNYTPSNCQWGTVEDQRINRRNVRKFCINGRTEILTDWCRIHKLPYERVRQRLKKGLSITMALEIAE